MPARSLLNVGSPTFVDYYQDAIRRTPQNQKRSSEEKTLTISTDGMALREFVRLVAQKSKVSIVVEDTLDERTVTLDVKGQTVEDVLAAVARRLGVQVTRTGDLYFLGELRPEDKGVLVRRIGRLNQEDIVTAVSTLTSENGRVMVDVDGMIIVGDRVEVLRRIEELIEKIEAAETRTWVVQLYVIGMSQRAVDDIGLNFAPALDMAVTFASATDPMAAFSLNAALNTILDYEQGRGDISTLAAPTFVVRDGNEAHTFVGEVVPIPKRSVGISGEVTTVEFDEVEIGLDITVKVREVGDRKGLIEVKIDRSRINGFVEDVPRSTTEQFETTAIVESKGVYLLGELQRSDQEVAEGGRFKIGTRNVNQWDQLQIWLRIQAIEKPVPTAAQGMQRKASPAAMSGLEISAEGYPSSSNNMGESNQFCPSCVLQGEPGPMLFDEANANTPQIPALAPGETFEGWVEPASQRQPTPTPRNGHQSIVLPSPDSNGWLAVPKKASVYENSN